MEDAFGTVILAIILIFGFISGPIYDSFNQSDTYINNYVKTSINNFQKQVRNNGYVDINTYNKFLNNLNKTRKVYKVQLIHSSKLIYPDGNNGSKPLYIDHSNEEIFNCIYHGKNYYMKYGDNFSIKVTETKVEESKLIKRGLYQLPSGNNDLLTFANGGMVQNEAY